MSLLPTVSERMDTHVHFTIRWADSMFFSHFQVSESAFS